MCCRSTRDHGAHPPTSASPAHDRTSQKLGAPADCVSRALCMCIPFRGRLVAVPPRHASPLQRPRTPRTPRPQPCLSCVRAPQLWVPILFSGLDVASVQAARSSRLLKPSAQATRSTSSRPLDLKPPAQDSRSRRSRNLITPLDLGTPLDHATPAAARSTRRSLIQAAHSNRSRSGRPHTISRRTLGRASRELHWPECVDPERA